MAKIKKEEGIDIQKIEMGRFVFYIKGLTSMYMHRFSKKAREQLLFPKGRINAAEKAENLKHDPLNEFREGLYMNRDKERPTAIHIPSGAFSKALAAAAVDMPGASKAQILRLVSVSSTQIDLYGIPYLQMDMVRSSDIAKTPDVRTRPIFREWCCKIEVEFVSSLLKEGQIANLLGAAGHIVGIGDWRPQKGGSHGKFELVHDDDPDFLRIMKEGGRKAQLAAIDNPECNDEDTEELYAWFNAEVLKREKHLPSSGKDKPRASRQKLPEPAHSLVRQAVHTIAKTAKRKAKQTGNGRAAH